MADLETEHSNAILSILPLFGTQYHIIFQFAMGKELGGAINDLPEENDMLACAIEYCIEQMLGSSRNSNPSVHNGK